MWICLAKRKSKTIYIYIYKQKLWEARLWSTCKQMSLDPKYKCLRYDAWLISMKMTYRHSTADKPWGLCPSNPFQHHVSGWCEASKKWSPKALNRFFQQMQRATVRRDRILFMLKYNTTQQKGWRPHMSTDRLMKYFAATVYLKSLRTR